MSIPLLAFAALAAVPAAGRPQEPPPAVKAGPTEPWFVEDEKFFDDFMAKLTALAKDGKGSELAKLREGVPSGTAAKVTPAKPGDKVLPPEEVYKLAVPSVFVVGSVYKDKDKPDEWKDGTYATAWVAAPDGVLVTNWHVFEDLEPGEVFGACDHRGNVYPVTEFLGGDKVADVAVVRIGAKGLKPLAVAAGYADVGSWVGVLSHPGDNFFVYTTGTVTRYSKNNNDDGKRERWMGLTAEYAGGSSGGPVLNRNGAVVGMAALTLTLDSGERGAAGGNPAPGKKRRPTLRQPEKVKPDPKADPKPGGKPAPKDPAVQMVLKMAVPGPTILKSFGK